MSAGEFAERFTNWMPHTITVEPWLGTNDEWGQRQFGASIELPCRIEDRVRRVRDLSGEEKVSISTLYVAGGPISPFDRITLPDGKQPPILTVSNIDGATEFDHSEVYL